MKISEISILPATGRCGVYTAGEFSCNISAR